MLAFLSKCQQAFTSRKEEMKLSQFRSVCIFNLAEDIAKWRFTMVVTQKILYIQENINMIL